VGARQPTTIVSGTPAMGSLGSAYDSSVYEHRTDGQPQIVEVALQGTLGSPLSPLLIGIPNSGRASEMLGRANGNGLIRPRGSTFQPTATIRFPVRSTIGG